MPLPTRPRLLDRTALTVALLSLAGCAIQPPRTEDPWQHFNRKTFAFNEKVDKAVVRPVAVGYRKITTTTMRKLIGNFYSNIELPVSIVNDLLQVRPVGAARNTGRFAVNTTIGLLGFFDPASELGLTLDKTDFGVTLARWGVPDGPYIVLPLLGPTTVRNVWAWPVDSYLLDPMSWYAREHRFRYYAEYLPIMLYYVQLRASFIDSESFLNSAYDPYLMTRDAYLQRRTYLIYHGNPPAAIIEQMQGLNDSSSDDIDQLLQQQQAYEQGKNGKAATAPPATAPAPATSTAPPASAASSAAPAGSGGRVPAPAAAGSVMTPAAASSTD
ncbi:MAG: VacJ family lipoprotein [Xanthomonadaceae bacterium]|nr:VacJ family lipoprotein [Xanthomonadaceae bacterium]MDE1958169.1 VacJ family lipoprotein [Xanthomonadaceae bacterium]MDE2246192.1 VacJ family lipoprotein [Xanthomonadaceae bacterium]